MKAQIKRFLTVAMVVALVLGVGYYSSDLRLRASDEDGTVTAQDSQDQAEQTLAPVEVVVPAEEPAPAVPAEETAAPEAPPAPVDKFANAKINISLVNKDELYYGDTVTLRAKVSGVEEGGAYSIQWQADYGEGWENIGGATGENYRFTVNAENASLPYRAVMICND